MTFSNQLTKITGKLDEVRKEDDEYVHNQYEMQEMEINSKLAWLFFRLKPFQAFSISVWKLDLRNVIDDYFCSNVVLLLKGKIARRTKLLG